MTTRATAGESKRKQLTGGQMQLGIVGDGRHPGLAPILGWHVAHFRPAKTENGWRTAVSADGKGFPDLVLVRERVVWVECKGQHERVSPEQVAWGEWLVAAGEEYYVWRPRDWEDGTVERILRQVGKAGRG
jgi:hypothetical protein